MERISSEFYHLWILSHRKGAQEARRMIADGISAFGKESENVINGAEILRYPNNVTT